MRAVHELTAQRSACTVWLRIAAPSQMPAAAPSTPPVMPISVRTAPNHSGSSTAGSTPRKIPNPVVSRNSTVPASRRSGVVRDAMRSLR